MKLNFKIKAKYDYKRINAIVNKLPQTVRESVEDILKNIRGYAIKLERGNNEQGILVEMVDTSTMQIKAKVYADPSKFMAKDTTGKETCYLLFEYFGTGRICRDGTYRKHFSFQGNRLYRMVYSC